MKKFTSGKRIGVTAIAYIFVIAGVLALADACKKGKPATEPARQGTVQATKAATSQSQPLTQVVSIANIRQSGDGRASKIMFNQLEEVFTVTDASMLSVLQGAFAAHKSMQITFDPWQASILKIDNLTAAQGAVSSGQRLAGGGSAYEIDLSKMSNDVVNSLPASAVLNATTDSLANVIPDMATAQLMFDYITHQACALPGPYGIDQCISFQYCEDGCYARAHKMCWVINNKFHYGTHKIFSFANAGTDELCVKAEKWGGCCVNWWYHVAPIVNIKTPSGTKAYVFDPAMFDQPVLLATWLHAQENPACVPSGDKPHVTMINIQPTASYWPADGSGYTFGTDPLYTSTNSTMVSYAPLKTCP